MTPEQTAEAIIEQVFIENEVDFYFDGGSAINLIAAAIREAVTVEREACAKIAEDENKLRVAERIRDRKP